MPELPNPQDTVAFLLGEIKAELKSLNAKFDSQRSELLSRIDAEEVACAKERVSLSERSEALEKRVTELEKWRAYLAGAIVVIGTLAGMLGTRIKELFLH